MLSAKPLVSRRELSFRLAFPRDRLESVAERAGRYYRPFDREKKPGAKKWRHIDNPIEPLKWVQKRIGRGILKSVDFPAELTGGLSGRSLVDNARPHIGQPTLVCLDLDSFFPHVNHDRVYDALRRHLGCSGEIANLLTKLTTFQKRLPQGSPASTFLANLVLIDIVEELRAIARDRHLALSCYIDDLTFSGIGAEEAIGDVVAVLKAHHLKISREKLSIAHEHEARSVTGIGVSRRLTKPRDKMLEARDFINSLAASETVSERDLARARGIVAHVGQVNKSQAAYLARRLARLPPAGDDAPQEVEKTKTRRCSSFLRPH